MSLNAALTLFLEEYPRACKEPFGGNPVADFVRHDLPEQVENILKNDERYMVKGSAGQATWAKVPWLAIFDRFITESAEYGYYVVYLVCEDFSGVYLSLNQGVTTVRELYGADAKNALKVRAGDFLGQLGTIKREYFAGPIDLKVAAPTHLGAYYEAGNICARYYPIDAIPSDEILNQDLSEFIDMYFLLSSKSVVARSSPEKEDDESHLGVEDLTKLREHKRIERNQRLSQKAKSFHGYTCEVCGFNFSTRYKEIGNDFIEAHHLTPRSELKGQKITLNVKTDFAVLCANCHRMIHRSKNVGDIEDFKNTHLMI